MIFLACDHAGFMLKKRIISWLEQQGFHFCDLGTDSADSVDYPDFAQLLCRRLLESSEQDVGILLCGSGIGMSISANRFPGIRAALCTSAYMAQITRKHNNANVLCLGARISGEGEVESILEAFLHTEFEGDRHARRLEKIDGR